MEEYENEVDSAYASRSPLARRGRLISAGLPAPSMMKKDGLAKRCRRIALYYITAEGERLLEENSEPARHLAPPQTLQTHSDRAQSPRNG